MDTGGEMAKRLTKEREAQTSTREVPFNKLTPEQDELLSLLAEECAEVIQVVMKIQRHGLDSFNPNDTQCTRNDALLTRELGDVFAAVDLLTRIGLVTFSVIDFYTAQKLLRVQKYLHHHPRKWPPPAAPAEEAGAAELPDELVATRAALSGLVSACSPTASERELFERLEPIGEYAEAAKAFGMRVFEAVDAVRAKP